MGAPARAARGGLTGARDKTPRPLGFGFRVFAGLGFRVSPSGATALLVSAVFSPFPASLAATLSHGPPLPAHMFSAPIGPRLRVPRLPGAPVPWTRAHCARTYGPGNAVPRATRLPSFLKERKNERKKLRPGGRKFRKGGNPAEAGDVTHQIGICRGGSADPCFSRAFSCHLAFKQMIVTLSARV